MEMLHEYLDLGLHESGQQQSSYLEDSLNFVDSDFLSAGSCLLDLWNQTMHLYRTANTCSNDKARIARTQ